MIMCMFILAFDMSLNTIGSFKRGLYMWGIGLLVEKKLWKIPTEMLK